MTCQLCQDSGWVQLAPVNYKAGIGARSHLVARWDLAELLPCKCGDSR